MASSRQIVLADADRHDLTKLAQYEAVGGYQALAKARAMAPSCSRFSMAFLTKTDWSKASSSYFD